MIWSDYFHTNWSDDTSDASQQVLTPDVDDKIYDRDSPNIARFGATSCEEQYVNFRQWIEWNGQPVCREFAYWSWKGKWKAGGQPENIILKAVSGSLIALPDTAEGCG